MDVAEVIVLLVHLLCSQSPINDLYRTIWFVDALQAA